MWSGGSGKWKKVDISENGIRNDNKEPLPTTLSVGRPKGGLPVASAADGCVVPPQSVYRSGQAQRDIADDRRL